MLKKGCVHVYERKSYSYLFLPLRKHPNLRLQSEVKLKHIGKSLQENVAHPNLIQDRWSMKWASHFRLPYLCRIGFIIEEEKICMQGEVQFIRYDNYFTCWTSCQKHKLLFETFCRYALYYILYKNNTVLERLWSLFAMSYWKQPHNLHHP